MQVSEFPADVLRFIERRIDSVPHLESLLLLWESPTVSWSAEDIAARVYVSRAHIHTVLQDLVRHGLIVADADVPDRYSYDTGWDESGLMAKVASAYRKHLVQLAGLIHTKATFQSVRDFARAFKFTSKD